MTIMAATLPAKDRVANPQTVGVGISRCRSNSFPLGIWKIMIDQPESWPVLADKIVEEIERNWRENIVKLECSDVE